MSRPTGSAPEHDPRLVLIGATNGAPLLWPHCPCQKLPGDACPVIGAATDKFLAGDPSGVEAIENHPDSAQLPGVAHV